MTAVSYADYVLREEQSETRNEYIHGGIRPVPPSTPDHSALAASVLALIGSQLPRGFRAFTCNLRLRLPLADVATYADGAVIAGRASRAEDDENAVTNPLVLIEVTGDETEDNDRNGKLDLYRTIDSVREILIVSHRELWLTLHRRMADGLWMVIEARAGGTLGLESIRAILSIDDVYAACVI